MKQGFRVKELAYVAMGIALTAVCSWISVPALLPTMVPFTLQTFAVCLVTALLGLRLGLWTVAGYILLGLVGVPVFSGFRGGLGVLLGTTGGYIVGFLFTALIVGLAVDRLGRKLPVLIAAMALGILLCYTFGTMWFVQVYTKNSGAIGVGTALAWCVLPYLLPDAVKIALAAVWKGIEQLRKEGYEIESVTRRGYMLCSRSDVLSAEGLARHLRDGRIRPQVYASIGSTNTALKALAAEGAEEGLALVAGEQTAGRGRMGRSFFSPPDSGVYFSLLLRPELPAEQVTGVTACAAVAVAETIEELSGLETQIKWVNDVLIGGRKVCGILSEGSLDVESGMMNYVVVGIGINTRPPAEDFPEELRGVAGAVFGEERVPELRCRLAAGVLDRLMDYSGRLGDPALFEGYRRRSLVLGREVTLLSPGKEPERALVLDLERDFALRVRLSDGSEKRVSSGEVSLRVKNEDGKQGL